MALGYPLTSNADARRSKRIDPPQARQLAGEAVLQATSEDPMIRNKRLRRTTAFAMLAAGGILIWLSPRTLVGAALLVLGIALDNACLSARHQQKPRRGGVCVFATELHAAEHSTSQTATLIPRSKLSVVCEVPISVPRAFSVPPRSSSAA